MDSSLLDILKAFPKKKEEPPAVEVCSFNEQNFIGAQLKDLHEDHKEQYQEESFILSRPSMLMSSLFGNCKAQSTFITIPLKQKIHKKEVKVLYQRTIYILGISDSETVKGLKKLLLERVEGPSQEIVLLYEGRILLDEEKRLSDCGIKDACNIIAVPTSDGGDCLRFMQMVLDTMTKDLGHMKNSLNFLQKKYELETCLSVAAPKIIDNAKKENHDLKNVPEACLVAIVLWTSNVLYSELNQTLRENKDLSCWNVYLKHLINGLKLMPYYRGKVYRGFKVQKDVDVYKKGEIVNWKTVNALSKKKEVARGFSSSNGMMFEVAVFSSRDISSLSQYQFEEEVLILPYSRLEVIDVIKNPGEPVYIKLREIPIPRSPKVVFWVDDNPENNLRIAKEVENKDISCVFAVSTKDALRVINSFQWILLFHNADFRVITDMVRYEKEDGGANYQAGVDLVEKLHKDYKYNFEVLIYCGDTKRAQESCNARKLEQGFFSITNDFSKVEKFLNFK